MLVPLVLTGVGAWLFALTQANDETAPLLLLIPGKTIKSKMGNIYNTYGPMILSGAEKIGISASTGASIIATESSGKGFGKDGRMIIRFEPKTFNKYVPGSNVPDTHKNQSAEYDAFTVAKNINENAAYNSISMGLAQVMGFNHKTLGYATPQLMFDDMQSGVGPQIEGMFKFIGAHSNLVNAAKNNDFATFAHGYNGPGYAANKYDVKLASAKQAFIDATGIV